MSIETNDRSLLDWLLVQYPGTPKTRAKQWILAGRVSLAGEIVRKPHHTLPDPGAALKLLDRRATTLACGSGWEIHPRVELLHLDACLAVVNKGPGLVSVPAPGCELSALSILSDFMSGRLKARDRAVAQKWLPPAYRKLEPLPVHRLDQYTSGVFCMATNPKARQHLIDQLKAHTMSREYIAYVEGQSMNSKGTWHDWVELSEDELRQHVVSESRARMSTGLAKEAITHYEVIAEYPRGGGEGFITKLRLRLETGRKHQIRVQAANAGLPLIGDRAYNPHYRIGASDHAPIPFPRQALHAQVLSLEHPEQSGKRMTWTAELPKDLRQLEAALRSVRR